MFYLLKNNKCLDIYSKEHKSVWKMHDVGLGAFFNGSMLPIGCFQVLCNL